MAKQTTTKKNSRNEIEILNWTGDKIVEEEEKAKAAEEKERPKREKREKDEKVTNIFQFDNPNSRD